MQNLVGIIGLGAMGGGMARSLARAGHGIGVCDVRPAAVRELSDEGATGFDNPRQLGAACGIIFTFPFKQQALTLADHVGMRARQVGATNVLRREADGRWTADMFDGVGLVRAVAAAGKTVRGQCVWLIGAGGAGSAIAFALADAGAVALHITDLNVARTRGVAAAIAAAYPACTVAANAPALNDVSILINATPVGLEGEGKLPIAVTSLPRHLTVVDIVPRSDPTRLLTLARASGCTAIAGGAMVEGQADAVLDFLWHQPGKT